MLLEIGLSVHPTVPRVLLSEPTRPTIAPTLSIWVPSVHPMVSFLFLSGSVLTLEKYTIFSIWHVVLCQPWDLEMSTKTC
jgi:hypothetical protein